MNINVIIRGIIEKMKRFEVPIPKDFHISEEYFAKAVYAMVESHLILNAKLFKNAQGVPIKATLESATLSIDGMNY